MRRQSGFSLLELMMVIAIIGALAAISIPSYGQYVLRSNRATGKTAVMAVVGRQEAFFNDRKQYATGLSQIGTEYPADTVFLKKNGSVSSATSSDAIYRITLAAYSAANLPTCAFTGTPTATQYAIVATPINQQARDTTCGTLCYTFLSEKAVSGTATDCWTR